MVGTPTFQVWWTSYIDRCVKEGGGNLIAVIGEIKNEMDPGLKFLD